MMPRFFLGVLFLVLATAGFAVGAPAPTDQSASPAHSPPSDTSASATRPDDADSSQMTDWYLMIFGASAPANPFASPAPSPPSDTSASATRPDDADGFQMTARYFQTCVSKATEIENVLQSLHFATMVSALNDKAKQRIYFLERLTERYPGARFDGMVGVVPVQEHVVAYFNSALKVDSIKDVGPITLEYRVKQGRINISEGTNFVTILIDQIEPAMSSYINVKIPAIKEGAEKILGDLNRKGIAVDTAESAILNDAYQLMSQTNKVRMDVFAAYVIVDPGVQEEALQCAATGYRERHSADGQKGDPAEKTKNKLDIALEDSGDIEYLQKLILYISAVGVLLAVFAMIPTLSKRNVKNSRKRLYNSLSPMVTRALRRCGASLWGRNLSWSRNYYIYKRKHRWLLCDGKEDKVNNIFQSRTRVEVCLRHTYFKIKITRLNGVDVYISLISSDLSKEELQRGLEKISHDLSKASEGTATGPSVLVPESIPQ